MSIEPCVFVHLPGHPACLLVRGGRLLLVAPEYGRMPHGTPGVTDRSKLGAMCGMASWQPVPRTSEHDALVAELVGEANADFELWEGPDSYHTEDLLHELAREVHVAESLGANVTHLKTVPLYAPEVRPALAWVRDSRSHEPPHTQEPPRGPLPPLSYRRIDALRDFRLDGRSLQSRYGWFVLLLDADFPSTEEELAVWLRQRALHRQIHVGKSTDLRPETLSPLAIETHAYPTVSVPTLRFQGHEVRVFPGEVMAPRLMAQHQMVEQDHRATVGFSFGDPWTHQVERAANDYADDPWGPQGKMRSASQLLLLLLPYAKHVFMPQLGTHQPPTFYQQYLRRANEHDFCCFSPWMLVTPYTDNFAATSGMRLSGFPNLKLAMQGPDARHLQAAVDVLMNVCHQMATFNDPLIGKVVEVERGIFGQVPGEDGRRERYAVVPVEGRGAEWCTLQLVRSDTPLSVLRAKAVPKAVMILDEAERQMVEGPFRFREHFADEDENSP
jgi:hypothetical protein